MSAQHTQGKVIVGEVRLINHNRSVAVNLVADGNANRGICLATVQTSVDGFENPEEAVIWSRATANRLAACWNACEGLRTDDLEGGVGRYIESTHKELVELRRQRDEMLQAMTRIRALPVHADAIRVAHQHADAAISNATWSKP